MCEYEVQSEGEGTGGKGRLHEGRSWVTVVLLTVRVKMVTW